MRSDFRRDSEYWAAYFFYQKCIVYCDSYYYYLLVIRPLFTRAHSSALQLSAIQKNEHNGHGDMSARLGTNTFACRLREYFRLSLVFKTVLHHYTAATGNGQTTTRQISTRFEWRYLFIRKDIIFFTRCWTSINFALSLSLLSETKSNAALRFRDGIGIVCECVWLC